METLKERIETLEKSDREHAEMKAKLNSLAEKIDAITVNVNGFDTKIDQFCSEIRSSNTTFVRWLIGTLLMTMICGLFFQFVAFHQVHTSVNTVKVELLELIHGLDLKIVKKP